MASSEIDADAELRDARIKALMALANDLTTANLLNHKALLSLIEAVPSSAGLGDRERVNMLQKVFDAILADARRKVPAEAVFEQLTSTELEAAYIAAAGELLGLSDESGLRMRCGTVRYDKYLKDTVRTSRIENRKLRAVLWVGRYSSKTAERHAKDEWWPAFLAAVESYLIEQRVKSVNPAPAYEPDSSAAPIPTEAVQGNSRANIEPGQLGASELTHAAVDVELNRPRSKLLVRSNLIKLPIAALSFLLLLACPLLLAHYLPINMEQPNKWADTVFPMLVVGLSCAWLVIAIRTSGLRRRRLKLGVAAAVFLISGLLALDHFQRYESETSYARSIETKAQRGDDIGSNEFNDNGSCPHEDTLANHIYYLRLTSCSVVGGSLRATEVAYSVKETGIYPAPDYYLATGNDVNGYIYYAETRFRTEDSAPLSACGVSFAAVDTSGDTYDPSFLFHLVRVGGYGQRYTGETLSTNYQHLKDLLVPGHPTGPLMLQPNVLASGKTSLPFIGRNSLPGWEDGTWTKLGVVWAGNRITFLVNDRTVVEYSYAAEPSVEINSISLAVMAGNGRAGGSTATCDFDYLHVRRLPG